MASVRQRPFFWNLSTDSFHSANFPTPNGELKVISQNTQNTQSEATLEAEMDTQDPENPTNRATQNGKAKSVKSQLVARISRLVRAAGLDYEGWRYITRRIRQKCQLQAPSKPKKLPRVLNPDEFRKFYKVVDQAEDVQHALMLRLTFYTGVRVSELCNIAVSHVDLENCKIFVDQGKGNKDRYRLFDLTWELTFTVWITTCPKPCMETMTRRNPRGTLRLRLANEGVVTDFFGDEFVKSLVAHIATVNLADLLDKMQMIALENPKYYSEPIVLLDGGLDS